jgi:hypothetical protein
MRAVALIGAICLLAVAAHAAAADPLGQTTVEQRIVPDGASGFDQL